MTEWGKLKIGALVRTTLPDPKAEQAGYVDDARANCRWGVNGKVVLISEAHGLSYRVEHEDGTGSWYEPTELALR